MKRRMIAVLVGSLFAAVSSNVALGQGASNRLHQNPSPKYSSAIQAP